ncbi:hypothetical protein MLD38_023337 [Melastoma candidum]|uniref:Uncharacterized protein n=1 Tax=Melastoma candidum TaxID=119954 RepID=A0ACB9QLC5_9MYRT|nr:hypothetical protein MLD38_023337 [Melastoma candidum]
MCPPAVSPSAAAPAPPDPVLHEFHFFRVYESGRIEKLHPVTQFVPASASSTAHGITVLSKDVVISADPPVSARLFLPAGIGIDSTQRLPLLFYVHGGGFTFESAFSPETHGYVSELASRVRCVAVSVEYRLAPAVPIPTCYDDSWAAFSWVMAHKEGNGPEEWITQYADLEKVFVAGDSAGGNISHDLAVRIGESGLQIQGAVLSHPFFGGTEDDAMWLYMCPGNDGLYDRRLRPRAEDLRRVGCRKVLVLAAEKDHLRSRAESYVEELRKSGWEGEVELVVSEGEDHCFHLKDLAYQKSVILVDKIVSFINGN